MELYNSRILVVDDEPRWADKISSILAEQGFKFISTQYGITKFKDLLKGYNLAILDVIMPRFDGFQIKNYLQLNSHKTRIILTSQFENYDLNILKKAKGADGWITKKDIEKKTFSFIMLVNKLLEEQSDDCLTSLEYCLLENIIIDERNEFGIQTRQKIEIIEILKNIKRSIKYAQKTKLMDYSLCVDELIIALSKREKDIRSIEYAFHSIQVHERLMPYQERSNLINELGILLSKMNFLRTFKNCANNQVFIVHGHDKEAKHEVAHFLEEIKLLPIILAEKPAGGKTIIENLEKYSDVFYAVVILTPDDCVYTTNSPDKFNYRARQNVILELGYFMGCLGRYKVCAIYKEGVETPSDIQGVINILMDPAGGWKIKLAKEMKHAGLPIDL